MTDAIKRYHCSAVFPLVTALPPMAAGTEDDTT
jgi:hypothetical protein